MVAGPRKGKMKRSKKAKTIAQLKTISPGVLVDKNYKPGKDPAMDAVIDKLRKNPSGLDRSGMGQHWKI